MTNFSGGEIRYYRWLERMGLFQTMYIISHPILVREDEQHVMISDRGYEAIMEASEGKE